MWEEVEKCLVIQNYGGGMGQNGADDASNAVTKLTISLISVISVIIVFSLHVSAIGRGWTGTMGDQE